MLRNLREHLEDFLEPLRRDSETAVAHAAERIHTSALRANFDGAALRRVLGRVAEQIADYLREPLEVAGNVDRFRGPHDGKLLTALGDERPAQLDGRCDDLLDVDRHLLQLNL